jgi:hypothetical protein
MPAAVRFAQNLSALLALCSVVGATLAGPLDPPAGPVSPTGKTLTEIEPRTAISPANTPGDSDATPSQFKITQPGSYYLPGNLTGVSGKIGIEIAASDVTLDLQGFRLLGAAGSLAGIQVTGTQADVAIRNGVLRGWGAGAPGSGGIVASTCVGSIIEDVRSIGNTGSGMLLGPDSMVRRCYTASNTQAGINASVPSEVSDCLSRANGTVGINTGDHSTVTNCVATGNTGNGVSVGAGAIVHGCVSGQNAVGIIGGSGLNASDCIARDNTSHGYFAFGASFDNCLSTANDGDGFHTDAAILTACRSTSNHGNGYLTGNNSFAVHSLAVSNDLFGFHAGSGYVLRNLSANNSLNQTELREIKFDSRGRADGNHLITFNSNLWGLGGPQGALFIMNSINGGFVPTFGGTEGPDVNPNNIDTNCNPSANYDLP